MKNRSKYILLSLCCAFATSVLKVDNAQAQSEDDEQYVPVAFGEQKKSHQSISSFTVTGEELLKSRASNLMIALQGKVPGLNILQNSGEPGNESFSINVRGYDSRINNSPLYLIDGIERNPYGVDIYEVASVTVLKDGAATALYGIRGSGGVILINTHRGINGKSKINITVDHAFQKPTYSPDFVDAYDYVKMFNERAANDQLQTPYSDDELERYRLGDQPQYYPSRDMLDDYTKDYSQMTRANINFKGGDDNMQFFTSLGYEHQGSMFENEVFDDYSYDSEIKSDRFNFRTNLDMKVNSTLDAWVYVGGFLENRNGSNVGNSDILRKLYETPNNAYYDLTPDNEVVGKLNRLQYQNKQSVYGMLNRTGSSLRTETRIGNLVGARQDLSMLTEGLSVKGELSFDVFSRKTQTRKRTYALQELKQVGATDSMAYSPINGPKNSTLDEGIGKFFYYMYNARATVDYEREFGDHYVSGLLFGGTQIEQQQILLPTRFITFGSRANYAYKDKYLAEVGFSYEGSEQFAKGNRFGFFPSLSLGWMMSEEGFLNDVSAIDMLKIRASIGQNGNSVYNYGSPNRYLYVTTWNTNATENQIGNEDITWETSTKANLGLDVQLLKSLSIGADVFYNKNTELMSKDLSYIPSGMSGLDVGTLPPANIGYGNNKGFEAYIAYTKSFNSGFNLLLSANIAGSKNETEYYGELPYVTTGDDKYAYAYRVAGYAYGQGWGYVSDGLFNNPQEVIDGPDQTALGNTAPAPGDVRYKDITGDGIVNDRDMAPVGIINRPTYYYGFNAQMDYKGFDLNIAVAGVADRQIYLGGIGRVSSGDNFTEYMKNAWTAENPTSDVYPRLGDIKANTVGSDYWIENGAFVRIKNIELGYTLPKTIANGNLRIYANAVNPFVFHSLPNNDFDPEPSSSSNYPIAKAINLGLNLRF